MNPAATGTTAKTEAAVGRLAAGPGRLLVVARGGMGKTEFLAAVGALLELRSVPLVRVDGRAGGELPTDLPPLGALVVDDAHLLSADQASALAKLWAAAPEQRWRMVVARRPGMGSATLPVALAGLDDDHDPAREQLRLDPLDVAQTAERIARYTGHAPDPDTAARLARFSGGSPRWLDRVLAGGPPTAGGALPAALVEAVVAAMAQLPPEAAALAVALATADPDLALLLTRLVGHGDLIDAGLTGSAGLLLPVVAAGLAVSTAHEARFAAVESLCARPLPVELSAGLHRLLDRRDGTARDTFERAARRAATPAESVDWWLAAQSCTSSDLERSAVAAGLAEASWAAGRTDLSAPAADRAGRHDLVAAALAGDGRWSEAADSLPAHRPCDGPCRRTVRQPGTCPRRSERRRGRGALAHGSGRPKPGSVARRHRLDQGKRFHRCARAIAGGSRSHGGGPTPGVARHASRPRRARRHGAWRAVRGRDGAAAGTRRRVGRPDPGRPAPPAARLGLSPVGPGRQRCPAGRRTDASNRRLCMVAIDCCSSRSTRAWRAGPACSNASRPFGSRPNPFSCACRSSSRRWSWWASWLRPAPSSPAPPSPRPSIGRRRSRQRGTTGVRRWRNSRSVARGGGVGRLQCRPRQRPTGVGRCLGAAACPDRSARRGFRPASQRRPGMGRSRVRNARCRCRPRRGTRP